MYAHYVQFNLLSAYIVSNYIFESCG